jgi:hypothetical protein
LSREFADKLFAPFRIEDFPADLNASRLEMLLNTQPAVSVPAPASDVGKLSHLWGNQQRPLFVTEQQGLNAAQLQRRLLYALDASWPSGTPSELLYTAYWMNIGYELPEFAAKMLGFSAVVHRWLVLLLVKLAQLSCNSSETTD